MLKINILFQSKTSRSDNKIKGRKFQAVVQFVNRIITLIRCKTTTTALLKNNFWLCVNKNAGISKIRMMLIKDIAIVKHNKNATIWHIEYIAQYSMMTAQIQNNLD